MPPPEDSVVVRLTGDPIDASRDIALARRTSIGAEVTFSGVVRGESKGRRVTVLEYEAYPEMALAEMRRLVSEARSRFRLEGAVFVHRTGRLLPGETAVLVWTASSHRAEAFGACQFLVDGMKRGVPVWKKEHYDDGAVWIEGDGGVQGRGPDCE